MKSSHHPTRAGTLVMLALGLSATGLDAGTTNPWVDVQTVSGEQPLEIRLSGWADSSTFYAGMLYNDGSDNVLDWYELDAGAGGITVMDSALSVDSGEIFALGDWCIGANFAVMPYIKDFDVYALRVDDTGTTSTMMLPGTGTANFTTTDCLTTDGGSEFWIGTLNFDDGNLSLYNSMDEGAGWSHGFDYDPSGDSVIGPFSGGFRSRFGSVNDAMIGISYQLATGPLKAAAFDPDGTLLGQVDFDTFSPHGSFIGNGHLKECAGRQYQGLAWGLCNGGQRLALSNIDLSTADPGFRLLNATTSGFYSFLGVGLGFSDTPDEIHAHAFSNRHIRVRYDINSGGLQPEAVADYPFTDIGGPVDAVENATRIFVGGGYISTPRGDDTPVFAIATLDPAQVVGAPLGDPAASVPTLNTTTVFVLLGLVSLIGIAATRRRLGNAG